MEKKLFVCDAYTYCPPDNSEIALRIVKTGWKDLYHVIIEDAVYGSKMLPDPLYATEIEKRYKVKLPTESLKLGELVKDVDNDTVLGGVVRSFVTNLND
jgi:hypothetical protein